MTTLGFIGLGTMGGDMAKRLIEAGHDVLVWNRSAEKVEALAALGARPVASPAEALSAEVSFSMLANDAAVEAVLSDEAIKACRTNTHVVMASISAGLADRLAAAFGAAGAEYVAAPVLGRPEVAAAGQLQILAAGDPQAVSAATPYLEIMGKHVWHLGTKPSTANAVKIAVNYTTIHALQAMGESVAMAERAGVDPSLFVDLLSSTLFGGVVYSGYGTLIAKRQYYPPGFTVALGRKDLGLAEDLAGLTNLRLATLPALTAVFDAALADPDLRDGDWSAIVEVTRQQ